MPVKVIISRKVPVEKETELTPLLIEMRALCLQRKGYISGETLLNADDPADCLVISAWESMRAWKDWLDSRDRDELQNRIDELLGQKTNYRVYYSA